MVSFSSYIRMYVLIDSQAITTRNHAYSVSLANTFGQTKFTENRYRVKGVSISTATNWAMNYVVGALTPILQDLIRWRLYPMHAFFCVMSFIIVFFTFPETRGVPLEAMNQLFDDVPNEKEASPERRPLAPSRSRSQSPAVRGGADSESQIEPPDLKDRMDQSGGVLGYLFGSEIPVNLLIQSLCASHFCNSYRTQRMTMSQNIILAIQTVIRSSLLAAMPNNDNQRRTHIFLYPLPMLTLEDAVDKSLVNFSIRQMNRLNWNQCLQFLHITM